jgi:hypothetical protein
MVSANCLIHERGNRKVNFRKENLTAVLFITSVNLFCVDFWVEFSATSNVQDASAEGRV